MDANARHKAAIGAASQGNWDEALEHAKHVPANWDAYQQFPSTAPMPDYIIHKVLDRVGHDPHSNFLFEMASNIPDSIRPDTLRRLAYHGSRLDDYYSTNLFTKHKNYVPAPEDIDDAKALEFWHDYEKNVDPSHLATIKSLYTGKNENVSHRGKIGRTNHEALPYLKGYSQAAQDAILKDESIKKKDINGKPHIQVWRGINGPYAKAIKDKIHFLDENTVKNQKFVIPTGHMSSWTTDPEVANRFVWMRNNLNEKGHNHGMVLSEWMPVDQVLHTSNHYIVPHVPTQSRNESEVVFGHPEGKMTISTKNIALQPKPEYSSHNSDHVTNYGKVVYPKVAKAENFKQKASASALAAGLTLATLGVGADSHPDVTKYHDKNNSYSVAHIQNQKEIEPHPELAPIAYIESSGGKNINHREVTDGLNAGTKAIGMYGIMPLQVIDTVSHDKSLRTKYPEITKMDHITDQDKIRDKVLNDKQFKYSVLNSHWNRLRRKFNGNKDRMAYAWLNGITGALRASDDEIKNHPYVKKYRAYEKMIKLQDPKVKKNLKKSQIEFPKEYTEFDPITGNDLMAAREINTLIKKGRIYSLPSVGAFTKDAFIVGDHDRAWLLKPESKKLSDVESAKKALSSSKEMAFYEAANRVFKLGNMTQSVILGILQEKSMQGVSHIPTSAIQLYSPEYQALSSIDPHKANNIMVPYNESGMTHMVAAMLYVLGDIDAHGENFLTDPTTGKVRMIDHANSFADGNFLNSFADGATIPYILRMDQFNEYDSLEEKLKKMPKIDSLEVNHNISAWLRHLDRGLLNHIINKYGLDSNAVIHRLEFLISLIKDNRSASQAINEVWANVTTPQ